MDNERYKRIKESIPSSIVMAMEHIRRYLVDGKASVMVGAGFSKNAVKPDYVDMKDWNSLGKTFFRLLYSHDPQPYELEFKTPIRLASQVEASFGRNELDNLILRSLPDDAIAPGELHRNLLRLKWRDVFTTNYDTLLERAYLDAGVSYNVVTNKDTLLYERSPRIVKLHGSFPDIHPFIITEEDFRTYPNKYPGFVNTVRQALIESIFCLIGFSGDDPNFLNWLGWLRDVMEDSIAPVYLVTYDKNIHESEYSLMLDRGIRILNLANVPELSNIQEALTFFCQYLQNEGKSEWKGTLRRDDIKSLDDARNMIDEMKNIRQSYPGWIFLPDDRMDDFRDLTSGTPAFWKLDEIDGLTIHDKINLMYELNWRLQVSMHPFKMPWMAEETEKLKWEDDGYRDDDRSKVYDLKLSMLRDYNEDGEYEKFDELYNQLYNRKDQMSSEQRRLLIYESCLCYLSRLDQKSVEDIAHRWDVSPEDYIGAIWKARILLECGKTKDANNLLTVSLQKVQALLLGSNSNSYRLKSAKTAMESLIALTEMRRNEVPSSERYMDSYSVVRRLKQDLFTDKTKKVVERKHDFRINRTTTTWNSQSGYNREILNSYRYFRLQENVGYPLGWAHGDINTEDEVLFIKNLMVYMPSYAIGLMLRTNNNKVQEACITRSFLSTLSCEEADKLFDDLFGKLYLDIKGQDKLLYRRSVNVLVPTLVKLCTKSSQDRILKMAGVMVDLYVNDSYNYKPELHNIVINCVDCDHISDMARTIYELPITTTNVFEKDVCLMEHISHDVRATDIMLDRVQNAIETHDSKLLRFAYSRLCDIGKMSASEGQTARITELVHQWRNRTKEGINKRFSFRFAPYDPAVDDESPEDLLNQSLDEFQSLNIETINSSVVFDNIRDCLLSLGVFSERMLEEQHAAVLTKMVHFMETHNERLQKDDSNDLMGGFRGHAVDVWDAFEQYLQNANLSNFNPELLRRLDDLIKEYGRNGFQNVALRVMLMPYLDTINAKQLIKDINENITNSKKTTLMNDAVFALILLAKKRIDIHSIIGRVVSYIDFSQDPEIRNSTRLLISLACNRRFNQKIQARINSLLNRLFDKIPDSNMEMEYKTDLYYFTLMLAGAMKKQYGATPAIDKWEALYHDSNVFNDVKRGFERGLSL